MVRTLESIIARRGKPSNLRCDNGPEFISHILEEWCEKHRITLQFIQSGKPMQNGYIERKNGSMRRELLNAYLFTSLHDARIMCEEWRTDYNEERPHKALGYLSSIKYLALRHELYPQTVNGNHLQIEDSRLVDKTARETETATGATLSILLDNKTFAPVHFSLEKAQFRQLGGPTVTAKEVQAAIKQGTATADLLKAEIDRIKQREKRAEELDREKVQLTVHHQFAEFIAKPKTIPA